MIFLSTSFHERQGLAFFVAAAGAADAVNVVFVGGGEVVIDDVGDITDVQATGGHVGGDEDSGAVRLEIIECADALGLALVAMDGRGFESAFRKGIRQPLHAVLGASEYEHAVESFTGKEIVEHVDLFPARTDADDVLFDVFGGDTRLHRDAYRLAEKVRDKFSDVG